MKKKLKLMRNKSKTIKNKVQKKLKNSSVLGCGRSQQTSECGHHCVTYK